MLQKLTVSVVLLVLACCLSGCFLPGHRGYYGGGGGGYQHGPGFGPGGPGPGPGGGYYQH